MDILTSPWKNLLIKGKQNSGKSELTLWVVHKILENSKEMWLNRLLDDRERVLLLTEQIDQVEVIKMNLNNKIHIVENITGKDPFEYIKAYNETYGLELLVIDYINLFNKNTSINSMESIIQYLNYYHIRCIFVEHTFKYIREDLKLENSVDCIIQTSRNPDGLELLLTKEAGKNLIAPQQFWVNL